MPEVETIPESATEWPELRLLVEWSSPWEEFKSALRPALTRSPEALAGEAPVGIFPYRGILVSWVLECLLLIALIAVASTKAGKACNYSGVTCNTIIGTACNGSCQDDVCVGTQVNEVLCSDGSIQFQDQ